MLKMMIQIVMNRSFCTILQSTVLFRFPKEKQRQFVQQRQIVCEENDIRQKRDTHNGDLFYSFIICTLNI